MYNLFQIFHLNAQAWIQLEKYISYQNFLRFTFLLTDWLVSTPISVDAWAPEVNKNIY